MEGIYGVIGFSKILQLLNPQEFFPPQTKIWLPTPLFFKGITSFHQNCYSQITVILPALERQIHV